MANYLTMPYAKNNQDPTPGSPTSAFPTIYRPRLRRQIWSRTHGKQVPAVLILAEQVGPVLVPLEKAVRVNLLTFGYSKVDSGYRKVSGLLTCCVREG
ncbi:hypothetical protein PoB_002384900 [Plakobranchus ocellatus]|uniref:Uncharacterized protein n=1 Tax=Plakobranchus ocellatus TaxID=259542 RepID=A0AAV3ZTY1_9GAST|nr:hypothetical protein PoB_002384900 [Plakobranchus ocellatus]